MLPVVAGEAETKRQILIYSVLMAAVAVVPAFIGLGGIVYGAVSAVLGAYFVWLAVKLRRAGDVDASCKACKSLFGFSILYLFLLFAVLLVEHAVRAWA